MFIAHIGVGFAAKRLDPKISLGWLLVSGQVVDILCGLLMVTGIEKMRANPGFTASVPLEFLYYPWSHGLFMNVVWAIAFGFIGLYVFKSKKTAVVLGAVVFSHWILDWISHVPDLPFIFGNTPKFGLGLWNYPLTTVFVEFLIFLGGLAMYLQATKARKRQTGLAIMVALFVGLFILNHWGPPPPPEAPQKLLALPILIFVVLFPWGQYIERTREVRAL